MSRPPTDPATPRLAELVGGLEVVICCGSGGVGKTTLSAALAAAIAATSDRRVMVLTIDPARRLATALGMSEIGADPVTVPAARLREAGLPLRGELVAAMLDQKSVWDRMVERHSPNRQVYQAACVSSAAMAVSFIQHLRRRERLYDSGRMRRVSWGGAVT